MKILYFGDVFGKPGRDALQKGIAELSSEHAPDFIIANGENACHGRGILPKMADEFFSWGVDVITTGNHVWDQKEIIPALGKNNRILRPANYPEGSPGIGKTIVKSARNPYFSLGVIQLMGRVFMDPIDCPFQMAEKEIQSLKKNGASVIFVDFHGEATSEKQAMAHFLDGKVAAVVGSHSHVQTADERILPGKTAAITDVGMCGCFDSVIGVKKEISIQKFVTKMPVRYEPAEGPGGYGAVLVDVNENTGQASSIQRFRKEVV